MRTCSLSLAEVHLREDLAEEDKGAGRSEVAEVMLPLRSSKGEV